MFRDIPVDADLRVLCSPDVWKGLGSKTTRKFLMKMSAELAKVVDGIDTYNRTEGRRENLTTINRELLGLINEFANFVYQQKYRDLVVLRQQRMHIERLEQQISELKKPLRPDQSSTDSGDEIRQLAKALK